MPNPELLRKNFEQECRQRRQALDAATVPEARQLAAAALFNVFRALADGPVMVGFSLSHVRDESRSLISEMYELGIPFRETLATEIPTKERVDVEILKNRLFTKEVMRGYLHFPRRKRSGRFDASYFAHCDKWGE